MSIDIFADFKSRGDKKVEAAVDRITKKAKKASSSKIVANFTGGAGGKSDFSKIRAEVNARKEVTRMERATAMTAGQQRLADMKKEAFENSKLVKTTKAVGEGLKTVAQGAATLDPAAFLQSMLSAAGRATQAIPFLGNITSSAADVAGIAVGAAGGALNAGRNAIQATSQVRQRNFTTNLYGGELQNARNNATQDATQAAQYNRELTTARENDARANAATEVREAAHRTGRGRRQWESTQREITPMRLDSRGVASQREERRFATESRARDNARAAWQRQFQRQDTAADVTTRYEGVRGASARGNWTPTEYANFVSSVQAGFGRIQRPLADSITQAFMTRDRQGRQANVELATQVAGGNWSALGTDEGEILQQISSSFSGALPSIRQAMQAELIKQQGHLVEREGADVATFRERAGQIQATAEQHEANMANAALSNYTSLMRLQGELNGLQTRLINAAAGLADAVATATASMNSVIPGQ